MTHLKVILQVVPLLFDVSQASNLAHYVRSNWYTCVAK